MLQRFILVWLVISSGLAFFWPKLGAGFDPFLTAGGTAIDWLIVATMFCVGAVLPVDEVRQISRRWPTVLIGTAIQYTSMPILAWLVVRVMQPGPEIATGIIIVGCVPGAMASNVLTLTARGNVSYSVSLTTMATMLSPIVVPVALWLTMDSRVKYDGTAAIRLLVLQVVSPVAVGHFLRRYNFRFRCLADRFASQIANLTILAIIAIAIALNRSGVSQASGNLLCGLCMINAGGYLAGFLGGRCAGLSSGMRRALTLEVGMQNAGAGVALAKVLFGSDSPALIPGIVYTFGCMLTGTVLATIWHRMPTEEIANGEQATTIAM